MAKLRKFGTFAGVFTPSILTILGVIMYLRLPTIIGQAGLWATIGIIVIAHVISVTTGLSVSSIATDKRVQAGGTYYMISRSLGLPIGGTLGIALFVGLSFSVSLYIIGFSESFLSYFGWDTDINTIRLTGSIALLVVTVITLISTSLALRMQFVIMAAIILSLISIVFGNHSYAPTASTLVTPAAGGVSLMVLFGIFFPAVTGFEAGVSMSGDLQDPKNSIPKGTIWAVMVGLVVYIALAFFFYYTVNAEQLVQNSQVLLDIALVPELVVAGIWGATISSALGSILGAPRIFQATAVDNITPRWFAKGVGEGNEPRNALLLTFIIAEAGILIGELDVIARIVSIFFITTYGFLNISAAFESWTSADFRPEFKIPIWVSILGAMACFIVMIQLDFLAMVGAMVILGALYLYLKRKELALESGDTWSGIWASLVKSGLEHLSTETLHHRNWRPNVIMFTGSEQERPHLVEMGQAIAGRLGILSSFELTPSPEAMLTKGTKAKESERGTYFAHQYRTPDVYEGMDQIARIYGFSGIRPNTILMGWSKTEKNRERFAQLIDSFRESDYNTVFLNYDSERGYGNHRTIDIWWRGSGRTLAFAISLIRHLTAHSLWKTAEPRLLLVLNDLTQSDRVRRTLLQLLDDYRMPMTIKLIDNSLDALPVTELIARESARTDLTLIGISEETQQQTERSVIGVRKLLDMLGTSLVIGSSSHFDELDLGVNERRVEVDEINLEQEIRYLPALPQVNNEWLAQDLQKVDGRNRQVLTTFYEQAFVPYFRENRAVIQELSGLYQSVMNGLQKDWEQYDDRFRRRRALQKATNDLFYQARTLLDSLREEHLEIQRDALAKGIGWYFQRLSADVLRFPTEAKITLSPEDLRPRSRDAMSVRWFKFRSRVRQWFTSRPPVRSVRYQQIASYYLRDNRYAFLEAMLREWQEQTLHFFTELRDAITQLDQQLSFWEKNLDEVSEETLEHEIDELVQFTESLEQRQQELQVLWLRRLQIEYRRNLRLMAATLESVNGLQLLNKRRNSPKVYETMAERITDFPEEWYDEALLQLNTVSLDVLLETTENRVQQEVMEFAEQTDLSIEKHYITPLERLIQRLDASEEPEKTAKSGAQESLNGVSFQKDLTSYYEDITKLVDQLPESMDISYSQAGEEEGMVRVPVQRLTNYWVETTLYLTLQNKVAEVDQQLQRSSSVVRDMVRLTNLQAEGRATPEGKQAVQDALKIVNEEKQKVASLREDLETTIRNHLQNSFEKLSTEAFVTQSGDLGGLTRAYQSQQVRTKVDQYQGRLRQLVRRVGTQLLYSRSQGILLAKRFTETEEDIQSPTARVLAFVEQVTPLPVVIRNLPFYYHTLFSGKSDISDDFWIARPYEMGMAEQAMDRLRQGYAGGILLLGERNSGKTALSWRMAQRYTRKAERIFQVYPTRAGSARVSDFTRALRYSTGKEGSNDQIIRALPADSAIIINDLELWWERSPEGMATVEEIMRLINDHSKHCLFIINTNPTAYQLINLLYPIADYFLNIIPYRPFTTEEIERLVLLRHWSGGLTFVLNGREEEALSEWKKAKFFNHFFDYSEGNPGVALGAWLSSIEKVGGKQIHLRMPKSPEHEALQSLPDDWVMMIIQFLLHKRLSLPRLRRVLYSDMTGVRELLQDLLRAGLLVEKGTGVYQLNAYTEIHLISLFKEQGII